MNITKHRSIDLSPVFFVGASAGGVKALSALVSELPADFPAPIFLLLHRKRDSQTPKNLLLDILKAKSKLPVVIPETGDVVKSGRIYLPAENLHIGIEDNQIFHSDKPDNELWRPSIDFLFKSGAREYRERAVSVLLTGKLDDGVKGLKETTMQGGVTIAQSPADAYEPYMPLNALLEDHPGYVLPLKDMPKLFCELANHQVYEDQKQIALDSAKAAKKAKEQLQ